MQAAVALCVGPLGGVAEDRHAEPGRGAAVVGVGVAEHDAREPAQPLAAAAIARAIG